MNVVLFKLRVKLAPLLCKLGVHLWSGTYEFHRNGEIGGYRWCGECQETRELRPGESPTTARSDA